MGSIQGPAKRNANLMRDSAIEQVKVIDRRETTLRRGPSLPEPRLPGKKIIVEISRVPVCGRQAGIDVPLADDDGIRSIRQSAVDLLYPWHGVGARDPDVASVVTVFGVVAC